MKTTFLRPTKARHGWIGAALIVTLTAASASAATNLVKLVNFAFQPKFQTNHPGDTVIWTNTTTTFHNVVSSNNVWPAPPLFTSPGTFRWTFSNAGTYGYYCSPHQSFGMTGIVYVEAQNQPPIVALTNPVSGVTLAAPATTTLRASASDPNGSVAHVQFFSGTTSLGTDTTSPYSMVVSNLAAGTYDFTARAVDHAGLSATSAVVTVSVVTPGPILFDTNLALVGGELPLRVTVTPGLSYEIDYTSTFTDWLLFTNFMATNSVMNFSAPVTGSERRFFRARQLPNP